MNIHSTIGIFGKLPAHGDFIHRNLPSKVINEWDEWLQTFIGSSQERMGESWLDMYLTSPIWRFCLSAGVFDDNQWAGIVLPSVDRVGRYFPFSVLAKLPENTSPCEFMANQQAWFEAVETLALSALDGQLQVDPMVESLNEIEAVKGKYQRLGPANINAGLVIDMDFDEPSVAGTMAHHLDAFVAATFKSYGIWSTTGSEQVEPCSFIANGMPPVAGASAMLDGLWEHWEWSIPVRPLDLRPMPTTAEQQAPPHSPQQTPILEEPAEEPENDETLRSDERYNI